MILSRTGSNINLDGARNVPMGGGANPCEALGRSVYKCMRLTRAYRLAIALGVAQGIEYFHTHADKTSYGNIKSENILVTTGLQVTDPYKVSKEADVYSFGVLLSDLLTRRNPNRLYPDGTESVDLVTQVKLMVEHHSSVGFWRTSEGFIHNDVANRLITSANQPDNSDL
nr:hypothetical protein [Tanacetum cinerariifolium]